MKYIGEHLLVGNIGQAFISKDFPDNFSTVHERLRSLGFTIEHSESLIRKSYIKLADKIIKSSDISVPR